MLTRIYLTPLFKNNSILRISKLTSQTLSRSLSFYIYKYILASIAQYFPITVDIIQETHRSLFNPHLKR